MVWKEIVGHQDNIDILTGMLRRGRMPHALLFAGPEGIGKRKVAYTLAAAMLCQQEKDEACGHCLSCRQRLNNAHPDLLSVHPDGNNIKIEQIRALQHEAAFAPKLAARRVCIIEEADRMTPQAANSLLKLLEEPPAGFFLILLSSAPQQLFVTIISRCLRLRFSPLPVPLLEQALMDKGFSPAAAAVAARLSGGRMGEALKLLEPEGLALRNKAAGVLALIEQGEMHDLWASAQEMEKMGQAEVLRLLVYVIMLLRDLYVIVIDCDTNLVLNIDLLAWLTERIGSWDEERLLAAQTQVAEAERALKANANVRLTLEALLINLMDIVKGGSMHVHSGRRAL